MINARLVPEAQAVLTPGEAVAGMMLNGLGFAQRPLSLIPPFFAHTPLELWCREGLEAELFNRVQLGRTLDDAYTYGGDALFQELARAVWAQEGSDQRFKHLDPPSCSRTGEDVPDSDAHAMMITHGDATDHRPDLPQAVLARLVSPDGGVPCLSHRWDGQTSDLPVCQDRVQALRTAVAHTPSPRSLVAEATRDHADKAPHRQTMGVISRLPTPLGVGSQVIRPALTWATWPPVDDTIRDPPLA